MMVAMEALFWVSVVLLVYTYAGYPALVWLLARLRPRRVDRRVQTPSVSVVMAVRNGAGELAAKLANLDLLDYPRAQVQIIVACDGCTDGSADVARGAGDARVQVLEFAARRGKAACLNDAVAAATGDVLLMTDVRQQFEPPALRALVANLADPLVGAAGGELQFRDADTGFAKSVDAYWRYEKFIRNAESRSGSTIGVTGAIYIMRRSLFTAIPAGTVLDDVLIPMQVARAGWRVVFEPAAVAWDWPSQEPAAERRRKVRTLAGNYQLVQLAPWLLAPWRNPLWLRFASHKLLRLLAPWLLLLMALSATVLAGQALIYAASLALLLASIAMTVMGRLLPTIGRWLPIRLTVAFFYMNLFAAQALVTFIGRRRLHLW
ncbi:glycosyltransferase family 2 protein [Metallibacterium sp.]|uniref:glycosyltransferase family 2 protein n=1 Tax=Metallibacterium sp. TaxID=2940281 RepID=UPI002614E3B3|nr:glycosyltransferase family 2 protein [Metallibacterium sp.]